MLKSNLYCWEQENLSTVVPLIDEVSTGDTYRNHYLAIMETNGVDIN